jgi:hypothetical protein
MVIYVPKGKNDNLIPFNERSKKEASESGKVGGVKSGQSRRRKKLIKEYLTILLEMKPNVDSAPDDIKDAITIMGMEFDAVETNDMLLLVSLFYRSLNDTSAQKYLDELMGRSPAMKLKREEVLFNNKLNKERLELTKQRTMGKIDLEELFDDSDLIGLAGENAEPD